MDAKQFPWSPALLGAQFQAEERGEGRHTPVPHL